MRRILVLAWHYIAYHKGKTAILTVCLVLTAVLPLTAHLLIAHFDDSLTARARATPLIVGAKGNRFDLVLKALYFGSARVDPIRMRTVESIRESGLAAAIPLHLRYTARNRPIVGTTLDYFEFRGLRVIRGTPLRRVGQAVLGATVAAELELGPGDYVFSDQRSLYDIARTYPLKMEVVGVLAESGSPDDNAVFVDTRTAWIIDGLIHGHQSVERAADDQVVLLRTDENVTASSAIVEYNQITPDNIDSFHTHGDPAELPISAILAVPRDRKSATLLKARYASSESHHVLVPEAVVEELMGLVFRVKRFFDANSALITVSTALLIALVVLLSRRLRQREMETMYKLGCSRLTIFWLQAAELGIVVIMGAGLTIVLSLTAALVIHNYVIWL